MNSFEIALKKHKSIVPLLGIWLDLIIWRNLRNIGIPYPLGQWIVFWIKCIGGI